MTITGKTTNTFNLFGSIKESTLYCTMLKGYGYNKVQYEIITLPPWCTPPVVKTKQNTQSVNALLRKKWYSKKQQNLLYTQRIDGSIQRIMNKPNTMTHNC